MKWLIAGLGNPGERYDNTRHNAGFLSVNAIAEEYELSWVVHKRFEGQVAVGKELLLLKPETFMNASGLSVKRVVDYYDVSLERLIVIHDDLDMSLGSAKVSWEKGPHIHNGLLSIESALGSQAFWRVRLGVDNRDPEQRRLMKGEYYVLKPLLYEEKKLLSQGIEKALVIVNDIMQGRYANR